MKERAYTTTFTQRRNRLGGFAEMMRIAMAIVAAALVVLGMNAQIALGGSNRTTIQRYSAQVPGGGGVGLVLTREESSTDCWSRRTPATLRLWNGRDHLRLHTSSLCRGPWRGHGHAPGVRRIRPRMWSDPHHIGATVLLLTNYQTIRREYHFELNVPGRRMHGWVTVHHQAAGEERIYEGSDSFVNFCIDHNQEIRSANGRLYCARIVGEHGFLKLHPHRWH